MKLKNKLIGMGMSCALAMSIGFTALAAETRRC